jgi:hypothetical protein
MTGTLPIPWWRGDRDYYRHGDIRREQHVAHITIQRRINARICASAGDGSYSVTVGKEDCE